MSDRISIPALRERAEKRGARRLSDGSTAHRVPSWPDVLALVEAVEAAHSVSLNPWSLRGLRALDAALACFDFGEQP